MSPFNNGTIIVGGGQAAAELASALRDEGYQLPVRIISDEAHLPYQRPPLSKKFLSGDVPAQSLSLRSEQFFKENRIDLVLSAKVIEIDRLSHEIQTSSGQTFRYDHLVLATGASNRRLQIPGSDSENVYNLRSISDAETLKSAIRPDSRCLVIGAGFVGLEVAATARTAGAQVTIVAADSRPLSRVVGPTTSKYVMDLHAAEGTRMITGAAVSELRNEAGRVLGASLSDGQLLDCDLVFYGIGAIANTELAERAGLPVGRGVLVDAGMHTIDPRIFAIGDCAEHTDVRSQNLCRLESVQNAIGQAVVAAKRIVGKDVAYDDVPWFWSDQFKTKVQIAGISTGYTHEVTRIGSSADRFSVFYFRDDTLIAVDSINSPSDHMVAKKLLSTQVPISRDLVANSESNLRSLI